MFFAKHARLKVEDAECLYRREDAECFSRREDAKCIPWRGAQIPRVLLGTGGFPKLDHFLLKINCEKMDFFDHAAGRI